MPKQLLVGKLLKQFFKKIPRFSINFFRNSNVSLELKQKEKLVFEKNLAGNLLKE
jgi:hypothetical protein